MLIGFITVCIINKLSNEVKFIYKKNPLMRALELIS
ncbi:hypothetical protein SASC598O11_014880 [Snodgrassella alvi SCGC AB-598-O11]|nr:hypothetical protein SASC598O11_014880 [Snodgrassella alvi SCGC AB-598-O11]